MKKQDIQELIDFIANSGLAEVHIKTEEIELSVKKHAKQNIKVVEQAISQAVPVAAPVAVAAAPVVASEPVKEAVVETKGDESRYVAIKSPMIGTFYRSASPDKPPFIKVGDKVSKGQPACIIEAMKLFNEIESEVSGTVMKVLIDNASPVEYDQVLFLVDPA